MSRILYPAKSEPVLTAAQRPEEVTESRWHQPLSEPVRYKRSPGYTVALIASGAVISAWALTQPETVSADRWVQPLSTPQKLARPGLPAHQQQALAFVPVVSTAESITPDKWYAPLNEPRRFIAALPVRAQQYLAFVAPQVDVGWQQALAVPSVRVGQHPARQQSLAYVQAAPFAESVSLDKWLLPLSEPVRVKPALAAGSQQHLAFVQASPFAETVSVDRWLQPLSQPQPLKRSVAFQQALAFWPYPIPSADAPVGYYAIYPDRAVKKTLPVSQQQSLAYVQAAPFAETVSLDRWLQPLSSPQMLKRSVAFQQALAFWPYPIPNVDAAVGFYGVYPDRATRKTLPVSEQQYLAFVKAPPFAEAAQLDKWYAPLSEPSVKGKPGLAPRYLRASEFSPYPIPPVAGVDSWLQPLAQLNRRQFRFAARSSEITAPAVTLRLEWFAPLAQPRLSRPLTAKQYLAFYPGPIAAAETVTLDKWFAPLARPTLRQRNQALYESASIDAILQASAPPPSLVCADIRVFVATGGAVQVESVFAGSAAIIAAALDAAASVAPAVSAAPTITAAVSISDCEAAPAVSGIPTLKRCD